MPTHQCIALDVDGKPLQGVPVTHFHDVCVQRAIADAAPWTCSVLDVPAGPRHGVTGKDGSVMIGLVSAPTQNHYFLAEYGGERLIQNGAGMSGGYQIVFRFSTAAP